MSVSWRSRTGKRLGGYRLKHQVFFLEGRATAVGNLQIPLSLGIVDRRFPHVGIALIFDALARSPCLYCLGLGSQDAALVRLLEAAGWQHLVIPFYFSIKSPRRFAANIHLPDRTGLQKALRLAGRLGIAGPALRLRSSAHRPSARSVRSTDDCARVSGSLAHVAQGLFDEHREEFSLIADRGTEALACLYPETDAHYIRLVVEERGEAVGWAVLLDTRMSDHKYFGSMRVGTVADCFAAPGNAERVVRAADEYLTRMGVDVVVSNQAHSAWCTAFEAAGYEQGPSNFFFYFSSALGDLLTGAPDWRRRLHLNRGDGDGPIHL